MGDSAGGGLVLSLNDYLKKKGKFLTDKIIAISPWLDVNMQNADIEKVQVKDRYLIKDYIMPIGIKWQADLKPDNAFANAVYSDIDNEKVLLYAGENEILQPDIEKFYNINKDKNITYRLYTLLNHDFPLYPAKESKNS